MFTLLQLSDCHFSADPDASYRGENPDNNLKRLLPACRALAPDGLVLSGDVSEDASPESYRRIAKLLRDLAPRRAWLPGNHDERDLMAQHLGRDYDAGPMLNWGGWEIVLLDSSRPDDPRGHLDEARLAPLERLSGRAPAMAFIHHQPIPVNAPWIDKYGMIEPEQLWQRLNADRDKAIGIKAIGFGHVHQAFVGDYRGITCLSAPSTVANSQAETERFTPDPTGPKARWYKLWPEGRWLTGLVSVG
ncbi:MAG: metallophosphoesterase [Wenzhouxiangella sp.]|nr:metallophosphoesterase [Wenzhouxiangella sp.]MCH8478057.1 metallophosphoesterase [Wenzhouxiangella sp.]